MALAKHHEEIGARWIENTSDRYEKLLSDLFAKLPASRPRAGEIYLSRNGRRMEDIEVFEVGEKFELAVISTPGAAEADIELIRELGSRNLKLRKDGTVSLNFDRAGTGSIQIGSGGYFKTYTIHAVERSSVQNLPDLAKLIRSMSDNPPDWTEDSFEEFRLRLEESLGNKRIPSVFTDAVIEYHMGLFHEERRLHSFRQRLEAAYGGLRWFIPYSDIARLICAYYLYCANEFGVAAQLCRGRRGRLYRAACLFLGRRSEATTTVPAGAACAKPGLSILVALPDMVMFQAIEALDGGRVNDAAEMVSVARKHVRADFDKERAVRLSFLEAAVKKAAGEHALSRSIFETLTHCPWPAIADASAAQLDPHRHG